MHVRSFRAHEVTICGLDTMSTATAVVNTQVSMSISLVMLEPFGLPKVRFGDKCGCCVCVAHAKVGDDVNTADTDYSDHSSRSKERINHSQLGDTGSKFHVADMAPILPKVQKLIWTERVENARTESLLSSDSIEDIET